jgi:hypothetical protein
MPPRFRQLGWFALVGAAQVLLILVVLELCLVRTDSDAALACLGQTTHGFYSHVLGYPVPWIEYRERYARPWVARFRESVGPTEYEGWNLAIPVLMLAIALLVPPVVTGALARILQWARRQPRPPLSCQVRLLRIVLIASTAALFLTWLEREASALPLETPWTQRQPGKLMASTGIRDWALWGPSFVAVKLTHWVPFTELWLDGSWPASTRLTLTAFLLTFCVGCAVLRPWRRADGMS